MAIELVVPYGEGVEYSDGKRALINAESGKVYATEGESLSDPGSYMQTPPEAWGIVCDDVDVDSVGFLQAWLA